MDGCPDTEQEGDKTGGQDIEGATSSGIRSPVIGVGPVPEQK